MIDCDWICYSLGIIPVVEYMGLLQAIPIPQFTHHYGIHSAVNVVVHIFVDYFVIGCYSAFIWAFTLGIIKSGYQMVNGGQEWSSQLISCVIGLGLMIILFSVEGLHVHNPNAGHGGIRMMERGDPNWLGTPSSFINPAMHTAGVIVVIAGSLASVWKMVHKDVFTKQILLTIVGACLVVTPKLIDLGLGGTRVSSDSYGEALENSGIRMKVDPNKLKEEMEKINSGAEIEGGEGVPDKAGVHE